MIDQAQSLFANAQFFDLGPGFLTAWGRRPGKTGTTQPDATTPLTWAMMER
jgi:hypothetical protein